MDRLRQMENEMSRFEAEISGQALVANYGPTFIPGFGNIPPPPQPPMLIPHQVNKVYTKPVISAPPAVIKTVYAAPPKKAPSANAVAQKQLDLMALQSEVDKKLKKLKNEKMSAQLAISQGKASSALQSMRQREERKKKGPFTNRKLVRTAGGQTWEDSSLGEWSEDDFRIFCGDLGNDVTDELLIRTFNKYPSFIRGRVIRDKRTNKSKGYGFVSFKEPADFTKAMKEMNGRYVGSRPIKLRKSTWKTRSIDVVKKKEKEKAALINMLTSAGK